MDAGRRRSATRGQGARRSAVVCLAAVGLLGVAGCESTSAPSSSGGAAQQASPSPKVQFDASVADGAKNVRPDAGLSVGVRDGKLHAVSLKDETGKELRGEVDGGRWHLVDMMSPHETYTLTTTAATTDGEPATDTRRFTTLQPDVEATYRVTPDKQTVGVGMPVMVTFDSSVRPEMRAAVERRLAVTTTPATTGSWGWVGANQVAWRPSSYWKPGTKVSVAAPLRGVQTGKRKWITQDKSATFTISKRARVSTVNLASHRMVVRENGKVVESYPISGGRASGNYETRSGVKVITEKRAFMVMDAASLGVDKDDPNYYRQEVKYAMRVTDTGEFLHAAPWSVWAQGRRNVSHGCVNMGPRAARNMFADSIVGDVVDFRGSGRRMKPGDGLSVWLYDWNAWKAKSALAPAPAAKKKPSPTASRTSSPTASAARASS